MANETSPNQSKPVLVAIDEDPAALGRIEAELERRYGLDYRIVLRDSSAAGLAVLRELHAEGADVAVVLADLWMPDGGGDALLMQVPELYPVAKRGLLIDWGAWGERATADAILRAMTLGHIDYYILKPWRSPDEYFHRTVAEFVHEWSRARPAGLKEVSVVGERWARRSHEVVSFLARSGFPHAFFTVESAEGAQMLAAGGHERDRLPVVFPLNAAALVDPSNAALAAALGVSTRLDRRDFDLVVVGAGPAGLAAAVYASSEGLRTLVVEREAIGGQASASSLIRNYLGFSRGVSGSELATRAYQQAWVFGTTFLVTQAATALSARAEGLGVSVSDGTEVSARAVILASGVSYRRLGVPELESLTGAGVFYGASITEAQALAGEDVFVVGGGNSAGQAAMHLARFAAGVTLLVRGASLASTMSRYLIDEIAGAPNVGVRLNAEVVGGGGAGRLERVVIRDRTTGATEAVPAAALFLFIGAHPHTDWLPDAIERDARGFVLTDADQSPSSGWPLKRPPLHLETSLPGVFAVGDVRHRSVKRVASAVGEGSVAIQQVHEYLVDTRLASAGREGGQRFEPGARTRA